MGHSTRRGRKVQKMTNKEFIETIGRAAVAEYERFKILPSLTIAQAILESGWGQSTLAENGNNLFGMKISLSGNNRSSRRQAKPLPSMLHFVHILMCRQASEDTMCFCSFPDTRI